MQKSQESKFLLFMLPVMLPATTLACNFSDFFPNIPDGTQPLPTKQGESTLPGTSVVTPPAVTDTIEMVKTVEGPDSALLAKDPCNLPGLQVRANFYTAIGANALLGPFSGDVTILNTAGGPNVFSFQQASVQRKFAIILPDLNPGTHSLGSTYMSYTEKTSPTDQEPKIWQAKSGFLQVLDCDGGGLALRTVSDATSNIGDSVLFQPLVAKNNAAIGDMLIGLGAKIK